jgi:hypothetical protein
MLRVFAAKNYFFFSAISAEFLRDLRDLELCLTAKTKTFSPQSTRRETAKHAEKPDSSTVLRVVLLAQRQTPLYYLAISYLVVGLSAVSARPARRRDIEKMNGWLRRSR